MTYNAISNLSRRGERKIAAAGLNEEDLLKEYPMDMLDVDPPPIGECAISRSHLSKKTSD